MVLVSVQELLTVEEAQRLAVRDVRPSGLERVAVRAALRRVLGDGRGIAFSLISLADAMQEQGIPPSAWAGYYDPPQIYTYDVVTAETNLFDAASDTLIWSGTTQTFAPRDVKKDAREFASVIIKALSTGHII